MNGTFYLFVDFDIGVLIKNNPPLGSGGYYGPVLLANSGQT